MNQQLQMALPVLWPSMATAGAVMLVAWWPRWRKSAVAPAQPTTSIASPNTRGWAGALAFGLAFAAAFAVVVGGMPKFPPPEKWQLLLPLAALATGFGLLAGFVERAPPARWIIGIACAAMIGFAFQPIASIDKPLLIRGAVGVATLIVWMSLEGSARRHHGFVTPLLLSIMFAGVSVVILQGHNANISLLAASVSAALGVVCALGLLLPPLCLAGGATHVLAALLISLLATAWMYGIGEPWSLGLIALAPLTLRGGEMLAGRAAGVKLFLIRLACGAIPVAAAVALAMIAAARQGSEASPYG